MNTLTRGAILFGHNRPDLPTHCRLVILCVVGALLIGCQGDHHEAALEGYLARLARTLSVAMPDVVVPSVPLPPRPGELRLEFPPSTIDSLDFLALSGCALQVTIGKRNSSLGRMAADSQRLLLELEFLRLAPECIDQQRQLGREALASSLETAWRDKREQLPGRIFNATLGGMEYRRFWRGSVAPGDYPAATSSQVITTLEAINGLVRRWLAGDYRADNLAFEILLGEVATGDGGALLEGLALQGAWLSAAENLLAERRNRGPLCAPGIRHEAADILPNVVQKFFVGGVQPYAAVLGRRQHQLLPPVEELETLLETVLPPAFRTWQQERNALLDQLVAAPRRQVEQLKLVLAPCGGFPVAGQVTG